MLCVLLASDHAAGSAKPKCLQTTEEPTPPLTTGGEAQDRCIWEGVFLKD